MRTAAFSTCSAQQQQQQKGLHRAGASPCLLRPAVARAPFGPSTRQSRQSTTTSAAWNLASILTGRPEATSTKQAKAAPGNGRPDAKEVVISWLDAYNTGDVDRISALIADDCVYHDMGLFQDPLVGKAAVVDFVSRARADLPDDLRFVIDDITSGDPYKAGVMWHVEIGEGTHFPFSRGCSFYTINDQGQIIQARDLVESPSKPGESGLTALKYLAPLIRKLGPSADPANLSKLPIAAAGVWLAYAVYSYFILISDVTPGVPAFITPPEDIQEILNESLNFGYINIALTQLGLTFVPSVASPPVSEALFNFIALWGVLFLPVILTEEKSQKVPNKLAWWGGIWFLTNLFFFPFMALRAAPDTLTSPASPATPTPVRTAPLYPEWTKPVTGACLALGLFSIWWAVGARPEYGDLADRWAYLTDKFTSNRVFFAFILDTGLYTVWQATLLGNVPTATPVQRFVPFFGLAAHLLTSSTSSDSSETDSKATSA